MKKSIYLLFVAVWLLTSCTKPEIKTGYVKVPTVTEHALSGVYTLLEPNSPTAKLYYEECGQGEPMILLHDYAVDCRMWDDVFFKLAEKFRVIRYDLRGYGKSDKPEAGYGYLMADDLKNLMDALGIQKAHLVGLSMGGMTVTDFIALYPEMVMTATITSGAFTDIPNRALMPKNVLKYYNDTVFVLKEQAAQKTKIRGLDAGKKDWKEIMRAVGGTNYRAISKKVSAMVDDWSGWQLLNPETDALMGEQSDSLISIQKKHPRMMLMIGQHDVLNSKKSMQRLAMLCPNAIIHLLPDAGHYTCMEAPDVFVENIFNFVQTK